MTKLGRATGLIRYSSQSAIRGESSRLLRPRVIVYPLLLTVLGTLFIVLLSTRPAADVTVLRNVGRPFIANADGDIENTLRVKITNRTDSPRSYAIAVVGREDIQLVATDAEITVAPGDTITEPVRLIVPPDAFIAGKLDVSLRITDDQKLHVTAGCRLLGPAATSSRTDRGEGNDDA